MRARRSIAANGLDARSSRDPAPSSSASPQRSVLDSTGTVQGPRAFNGQGSSQLDSWIAIAADGSVTAYTGKASSVRACTRRRRSLSPKSSRVADRSRHAGSVRHRDDARSGNDVGQPVASDELQPEQPRARCGDGARSAAAAGVGTTRGARRGSGAGERRDQRQGGSFEEGQLRRAGRREALQPAAQSFGQAEAGPANGRCSASRCRGSTCRRW